MITYGVACPHCKGAIKVEVALEKTRVLVSAVGPPRNGGGRVKPGISQEIPPRPARWEPPSNGGGADFFECPEHGRSARSRYGGLYCPAQLEDGSYCKWRHTPLKV